MSRDRISHKAPYFPTLELQDNLYERNIIWLFNSTQIRARVVAGLFLVLLDNTAWTDASALLTGYARRMAKALCDNL